MNKFLAALAIVFLTGCQARAEAPKCTPLLPFELQQREYMEKGLFQKKLVLEKAEAQQLADKLSVGLKLEKLVGVERVVLLFNKEHQKVAVYPLQRLSTNGDLENCHFLVLPIQLFVQALQVPGQEI
ncbi:hypothetical protein [Mesorhizobium sp. STM 4661]|uniref:hypothetical protein n=1 Tax=Mesorhizobium sp. STM 4661 TaxID=1297570 RepID=UPI0002BDB6AC|nr:hypothetical protein [Mesorhizobium sp. STM 4661]CCV12901.1 exported hypothetical protein [Mesorhizobium sp. STM 4661]